MVGGYASILNTLYARSSNGREKTILLEIQRLISWRREVLLMLYNVFRFPPLCSIKGIKNLSPPNLK